MVVWVICRCECCVVWALLCVLYLRAAWGIQMFCSGDAWRLVLAELLLACWWTTCAVVSSYVPWVSYKIGVDRYGVMFPSFWGFQLPPCVEQYGSVSIVPDWWVLAEFTQGFSCHCSFFPSCIFLWGWARIGYGGHSASIAVASPIQEQCEYRTRRSSNSVGSMLTDGLLMYQG